MCVRARACARMHIVGRKECVCACAGGVWGRCGYGWVYRGGGHREGKVAMVRLWVKYYWVDTIRMRGGSHRKGGNARERGWIAEVEIHGRDGNSSMGVWQVCGGTSACAVYGKRNNPGPRR